jgi:hypothetical protein
MKKSLLALALLTATSAFAQDKTVCRHLGNGEVLGPDDTIVTQGSDTLVCRTIKPATVNTQRVLPATPAVLPTSAPATVPLATAAAEKVTIPGATSAANQPQATIFFYRPHRFVGAALKPSVFVDETAVGRLHNGDTVKFLVPAGTHQVYSNDKNTGLSLETKPGQTYYVRVDIQMGALKGHGSVTLMDPQQGKYEINAVSHKSDKGNAKADSPTAAPPDNKTDNSGNANSDDKSGSTADSSKPDNN